MGIQNWVICHFRYVGNVKAAVRRLAVCHWTVSDQECGWKWSGLTALENTGCKKSSQKWEHGSELPSTAHSWRYRQLFMVLGWGWRITLVILLPRPTSAEGEEATVERTKFCYKNYNISGNSSWKLLMDSVLLDWFHSHSCWFLQ